MWFIRGNAFSNCPQLKSIQLPKSLKKIGDHAFFNCRNLVFEKLDICGIEEIGSNAFTNNIISEIIYDGNTITAKNSFRNCQGFESLVIKSGAVNVAIDLSDTMRNSVKNISIPNSVRTFKQRVFADCINIKNINIPNDTVSIGAMAFYGCENLSFNSLKLKKADYIGAEAFHRVNVKSVSLKQKIELADDAFDDGVKIIKDSF